MTDEPRNPEGNPIRSRPLHESLERVVTNNFWRFAIVAAAGILAYSYYSPDLPTVPRYAEVVLWTAILGSPFAYILSARAVDMLYDPFGVLLVDLDAREAGVAIYNIPQKRWQEIEVLEGQLYQANSSRTVYFGKNYDMENKTIEGTWRGSASDLELLREQEKVDEIRGQLEDFAKRGFTVHVRRSTIVRSAVRDISMAVIRSLESNIVFGGERIDEAVENAVAKYDFDSQTESNTNEEQQTTPDENMDEQPDTQLNGDLEETDAV